VIGFRKIFLFPAVFIALGHSFVPHSHDKGSDLSFHQHNNHLDLFDLVACFFTVDHESEDFENYLSDGSAPAIPAGNYAVIPSFYAERSVPSSPLALVTSDHHDCPSLRGPPHS